MIMFVLVLLEYAKRVDARNTGGIRCTQHREPEICWHWQRIMAS